MNPYPSPFPPAVTAADLRKAAQLIKTDGWTQGTYHDQDGCHCAAGAIAAATGQHVLGPPVTSIDWDILPGSTGWYVIADNYEWDRRMAAQHELEHHVGDSVASWNDTPGRTVEEVLTALELTARSVETTS